MQQCWATWTRLCFCQERLDQTIPEVPSKLVFHEMPHRRVPTAPRGCHGDRLAGS